MASSNITITIRALDEASDRIASLIEAFRKCLGCSEILFMSDPDFCERCDLHSSQEANLGQDNE